MSNSPQISGVSGFTVQPDVEYRTVTAGATLVQGTPVIWNTTTSYDGHTVIACAAGTLVCGVVMAPGGVTGDKIRIQTRGDIASGCGYVITDEGVTAGQGLIPGTAVADSNTLATALAAGTCFGYAAAADSSTSLTSGMLHCLG